MGVSSYPPPALGVLPVGALLDYPGPVTPPLWLDAYGQSVLRASYASLLGALTASKGVGTVTLASPGVWTTAAHGLVIGDPVYVETTGALPTGMTADTTYYVKTVPTSTTFTLGTTRTIDVITGAVSVTTAVNTSGSQSGVHTVYYAPYGVADATHFYLPDYRGRTGIGLDNMGGSDAGIIPWANVLGLLAGENAHTQLDTEVALHAHGRTGGAVWDTGVFVGVAVASGTYANGILGLSSFVAYTDQQSPAVGNPMNNMQPGIGVKKIIYAGA